jgi:hypothetical protein
MFAEDLAENALETTDDAVDLFDAHYNYEIELSLQMSIDVQTCSTC